MADLPFMVFSHNANAINAIFLFMDIYTRRNHCMFINMKSGKTWSVYGSSSLSLYQLFGPGGGMK